MNQPAENIVLGTAVGTAIGAAAGALFWGFAGRRFLGAPLRAGAVFGVGAWFAGDLIEKSRTSRTIRNESGSGLAIVRYPLVVANVPGVLAVGAAAAAAGEINRDVRITLSHADAYAEESNR